LFVSLACVPGVQMMKATAKHPQWLKKRGPQEMTHHPTPKNQIPRGSGVPKSLIQIFLNPPKRNHGKNPGAGYHGHGASSQSKFGQFRRTDRNWFWYSSGGFLMQCE
jgi:hypothetical protein